MSLQRDIIPQIDRHGIPMLQGPYTPAGQPMLCKRCGRPLTSQERQADGMGMCCRHQEPHRRRIQFQGVDENGASRFTIYSLTRGGHSVQHQVLVHFENGEFHCSCEDHLYRQSCCKHIARACDWEKRRRKVYEHSCPQCLGYFDGPGDCPTCAGQGTIREVW